MKRIYWLNYAYKLLYKSADTPKNDHKFYIYIDK